MTDFSDPGELGVFIDDRPGFQPRKEDVRARLPRRLRDGRHLQHAARQRPDLVLRGQQLPDGQGSVPVRPAVLELRLHPHAGEDAQLLPAQHVPEEPAQGAGRHRDRRAARRSTSARSRCRATSSPPSKTTSRRGRAPTWRDVARRPDRFVLGGSGHIAGIVNRPANKYGYWTSQARSSPETADAWLEGASSTPGSWWTDWQAWRRRSGSPTANVTEPPRKPPAAHPRARHQHGARAVDVPATPRSRHYARGSTQDRAAWSRVQMRWKSCAACSPARSSVSTRAARTACAHATSTASPCWRTMPPARSPAVATPDDQSSRNRRRRRHDADHPRQSPAAPGAPPPRTRALRHPRPERVQHALAQPRATPA